jgi:hypothetical protein
MYPTVSDQLREIRRVLATVVQPEVGGAYARETLSAALETLRMLQAAWDKVLPFLRWDNDEVARLLGDAARSIDAGLAGRIALALATEPPDPTDFAAVHQRNLDLRALLAAVVAALPDGAGGGMPAPVVAYVRERVARYPFSATVALPSRG